MLKRLTKSTLKPLYLTTPIFYVNARPHLGHLYSMLFADIRSRWEKLNPGKLVFFTTGTDEHGLKVQNVAINQGIDPQQLVDKHSKQFKSLAHAANIDYNKFIRTTDPHHTVAVQYLWQYLLAKDLIYKSDHSGWYSINDETFVPENQIEEINGKKIFKESKHEVVYQTETNYFFKLSLFQDKLIDYIEHHPEFIIPKNKYAAILHELKSEKLKDLSISRPSSRLTWGIDVPNDPDQKIYVWFDALINYLTSCGFPQGFNLNNAKLDVKNPWPPVHIIGKDIARFHCIYWPIILMAANIELPKQIVVHSHWLNDGIKMSKSLGNVVEPSFIINTFGSDIVRFFLMQYSNLSHDSNYNHLELTHTHNNIINKYGNLITRIGSPNFNIKRSVEMYNDGKFKRIDNIIKSRLDSDEAQAILHTRDALMAKLTQLPTVMDDHVEQFEFSKAVQEWYATIELANQFITISQPWRFDGENTLLKNYFILIASETIRICTILIQPIMPKVARKVFDRLNVPKHERNVFFIQPLTLMNYGEGANDKGAEKPFKRIV